LAEDAVYMHQDMKDGNLCLAAEVTVYIRVRMDPLYKDHNLYPGNLVPLLVDMNTLAVHIPL
jgi:hypothetical protein